MSDGADMLTKNENRVYIHSDLFFITATYISEGENHGSSQCVSGSEYSRPTRN